MSTTKQINATNPELAQAETDAKRFVLNTTWAQNKANELRKAGDHEQAEAFQKYADGVVGYEALREWAYKYWTVDTIDRGVSDPFLPKSTMTKKVYVDRGSYLHPLNRYHSTLGVSYLQRSGKTLVQDGEDYYLV